jgi:predicted GNAT family acetyltransferase
MSSTTEHVIAQANSKAMLAYVEKKPEWMQQALTCVNRWGRGEGVLQHLVALALEEAYARGAAGDYPEYDAPINTPTFIRRTRQIAPITRRVTRRRNAV